MKRSQNNQKVNHTVKEQLYKKSQEIRRAGILLSILIGLQCEALFFYVFGINPVFVPVIAILLLWAVNSVMIGCVVDEFIKRKYRIRLYAA